MIGQTILRHAVPTRPLAAAATMTIAGMLLTSAAGCRSSHVDPVATDAVAPFGPPVVQEAVVDGGVAADTVTVDPADVMFQSSEPFAKPASDINVFGELDGLGPTPFEGGTGGYQQVTLVEEGYDADQTVSPDGKWLLFSSTRHSERPDLYLQKIGGQAVTQLTSDGADDSFPRFSPDGRQIVFASNRAGNWDVYLMDVEGKNVRALTRSNAQEIHPSFSPDGTRIVYSALNARGGQWELWTLDLRSNERKMIGFGLFPEWSPRADKDVIAFQRARQRGTRWFSVWTLELADGEARDLTEIAYSPTAALVAPTWSPDGRRVAFGSIQDPQVAQDAHARQHAPKTAKQDVWVAEADGSDRRQISDGKGTNASPAWGTDGRIYFVSNRGGSESIWSVPSGVAAGTTHAHGGRVPRLPETGVGPVDVPFIHAEPASKRVKAAAPEPKPLTEAAPVPADATHAEPSSEPLPMPHDAPQARPQGPKHGIVNEPIVLTPVQPAKHSDDDDAHEEQPVSANHPATVHGGGENAHAPAAATHEPEASQTEHKSASGAAASHDAAGESASSPAHH